MSIRTRMWVLFADFWPLAKCIGVAVLACFALWLLLDGCYREPTTFLGLPE